MLAPRPRGRRRRAGLRARRRRRSSSVGRHRVALSRAASFADPPRRGARRAHRLVVLPRLPRGDPARAATRRHGRSFIRERGFACKAEILVKLDRLGARVEEVPVDLDASRREGESKMRVLPTMGGYARLMARQARRPPGARPHDPAERRHHRRRPARPGHRASAWSRPACAVTVYERDAQLGGLAGTTPLGGIPIDRYYHVVLPTDDRVRDAGRGGRAGRRRFRFRRTGVGLLPGRPSGLDVVGPASC